MNSALSKVSNLKVNKASKIVLTFASSVFFLYALGQDRFLKIFLQAPFLVLVKKNFALYGE